jgi:hypothetical protein
MHTKWGHGAYKEVKYGICCIVYLILAPVLEFLVPVPAATLETLTCIYVCIYALLADPGGHAF